MSFEFGSNLEEKNSKLIKELKDENSMLRSVVGGSISSMKDFKRDVGENFKEFSKRQQEELEENRKAFKVLLNENRKAFKSMEDKISKNTEDLRKEVRVLATKVKNLSEYVGRLEVEKEKEKLRKLDEEQNQLRELLNFRKLTRILNERQFEALQEDCGFCGLEYERIYRASEDGFGSRQFHAKCDSISGTLVIIESNSGHIFGGYNPFTWNSSPNGYYNSIGSWVFGFQKGNNFKKFRYNGNGYGIMCSQSYGPTFGGNHDLHISNNSNQNFTSYTNLSNTGAGSYVNSTGRPHYLNGGARNFQVREIEVFKKKN